eukprot:gene17261-8824_t
MTRKEDKIHKLATIYGSKSPHVKKRKKKVENKTPKPSPITPPMVESKPSPINIPPITELEYKAPKSSPINTPPIIQGEESEKLEPDSHPVEEVSGKRKLTGMKMISLPPISEDRPLSQSETRVPLKENHRRLSLPIINSKNCVVSQVLKLDEEGSEEKIDVYQKPDGNKAWEPVTSPGNISNNNSRLRRRKSSVFHAQVYTPASRGARRRTIHSKDVAELIEAYEKKDTIEDLTTEDTMKDGNRFRRVANLVGKAAVLSKLLVDDLNLRYIKAELFEPDYNDKYKRLATPDIDTDEENEEAILTEMYSQMKYESGSQSEAKATAGSSDDEEETDSGSDDLDSDRFSTPKSDRPNKTETANLESNEEEKESDESGSVTSDLIPDDVKELIKTEAMRHDNEHLFELGIWKPDAFVDNAQEADDEESEDDWSLKSDAEEDDDKSISNAPQTPEPEAPEPEVIAKVTPEPEASTPEVIDEEMPVLPKDVALPTGDTPDILSFSSETESSCVPTIYASYFDEYESDVFSKRLLENIFFLPSSVHSDGDSDMFYCVPVSNASNTQTPDYFCNRKQKVHNDNHGVRRSKKRRRKDLDDQYVRSSIKKYAVHDATIVQYGGATKAFRLRMAKLGKDPKETDDKINTKLERKILRRLKRRKKAKKLTAENLKKLPNIGKTAKVLRWVTIHKRNMKMNVVYQNSWTGNENLSSSMRLRGAGGGAAIKEERTVKRKVSLGVRSVGEGENFEGVEQREGEEANEQGSSIEERERASGVKEQNTTVGVKEGERRKKKFRKRRKKRRCDDQEKDEGIASEDSLVIIKNWQVHQKRKGEVDSSDEQDKNNGNESPRSEHSSNQKYKIRSSDAESGLSVYPPESPGLESASNRVQTPETEHEPEIEEDCKDNKERNRSTATSHWKLLQPKLQKAQRRRAINTQFVEMTRQLFAQLSLRTKEYTKLPPIKHRNRAFSMATSRFSNFSQKKSPRSTSERSKNTNTPVSSNQ